MKKIMSIFTLCLLFTVVASADNPPAAETKPAGSGLLKTEPNNIVVREVIGQGHNRDEAIKNALYKAVGQVRGVKVDSGDYEFIFRGAGAGIGTEEPGGKRIEFDSVDVATRGTVYTTEIGGPVKTYEVLEEEQIDEDTYQVKLRVAVYDYGERGKTKRVKVALMPVKTMQRNFRFLDVTIPDDVLSSLFSQRLTMGLTQTNSDFAKEKNMLLSFDAPLGEQAKLAETLGADYLLVGTINQAQIDKISKYLKVADYTTTEFKARFNFNYQLVDSSTKQVVLASTVQKYLENEEVRELADEQDSDEWDPAQVRDAFISLVVNDVIEAIIDRVYPIKVAAVQDGQIILNQGGDRMAEGMLLEVFTEGKEIFDNITQESLGKIESHVATIEVHKVTYTISFAKVVEGDLSKVSEGLVCRVKKTKKDYERGVKPDIIRTKTGGVKLPFDK